jgi:major membrane immunogen (membrane-anchored lipoprotein)
MKGFISISGAAAIAFMFALSACSTQEEVARKPAPAPASAPAAKAEAAPAKAQVSKTKGDVGLLDTEKNYMILVTKDGKLVTLDFDAKTKVTKLVPTPAKMADVGLGSAATVTYTKNGGKNIASGLEYKAKKGGE